MTLTYDLDVWPLNDLELKMLKSMTLTKWVKLTAEYCAS